MEIKAQHKNARMAPRKLRQYRQLVRGLSAREASAQLKFLRGEAPAILLKVLRSAVANAENNFDLTEDNLKVADVVIDGGFVMKRFQPVSKGMAHPILKRTSHVTVVMSEIAESETLAKRPKRKTEIEEFTAADVASGKVGGHVDEGVEADEPKGSKTKPGAAHPSKQEEAFQKVKMMQQGGDPKKTHRRKSLGE